MSRIHWPASDPVPLTVRATQLYIVRMKHVTASEARKSWFKLLDEAARGEIIAIQRNDKKLILRLERRRRSVPQQSLTKTTALQSERRGREGASAGVRERFCFKQLE